MASPVELEFMRILLEEVGVDPFETSLFKALLIVSIEQGIISEDELCEIVNHVGITPLIIKRWATLNDKYCPLPGLRVLVYRGLLEKIKLLQKE